MPNYLTLVRPWHVGPSRELARTRVFTLKERPARSAADPSKAADFVYLDCADWANVVAVTPDRKVVMVEQYRHGIGQVTLEIPGGIVDEGQTPAQTCARELLEETGYAARGAADETGAGVEMIGKVSANPAIMNNWCHTGLIRDAVPVHAGAGDHLEEIGVRLVPVEEIPALIRRGIIHHALIVAALHFYLAGRDEATE